MDAFNQFPRRVTRFLIVVVRCASKRSRPCNLSALLFLLLFLTRLTLFSFFLLFLLSPPSRKNDFPIRTQRLRFDVPLAVIVAQSSRFKISWDGKVDEKLCSSSFSVLALSKNRGGEHLNPFLPIQRRGKNSKTLF